MTYDVETPRLWLERLEWKHLNDFHAIWSSPETMIWSLRPPKKTLEESRAWIQESFTYLHPKIDKYGIILRPTASSPSNETPKMIGLVGTKGNGDELVYMIHCDYWRKGYMTEALNAFGGPDGVFWKLPNRAHIQTLMAEIDSENYGSLRTIAKVGGRKGETLIKSYGLGRDKGPDGIIPEDKKRDLECWHLDRPRP